MNTFPHITIVAIIVAMSLVVLAPTSGQAADQRLDMAAEFLTKAKALINAAEDPAAKKPFGGHVNKASNAIEKALHEIALAKQSADSH